MTVAADPGKSRSRGWKGVGELFFELLVFGTPAFFLSGFLMELTGGALWVPEEWRRSILGIGLGAGLACFHLARIHVQRKFPRTGGENLDAEAFAQKRTLLWAVLTVVALCAHTWLRFECVRSWDPSERLVAALFSDQSLPDESDADARLEPVGVAGLRPPVYLEPGPPYRGSFLFPYGFPRSAAGRALIEEVRYVEGAMEGKDLRGVALRERTNELIALIRDDERQALAATVGAFVVVHFLLLCVASVAYGYGFSWAEETAGGLRQLFG